MGILYHSFVAQKARRWPSGVTGNETRELRWTNQFKFHSLLFCNWMGERLQSLFWSLFLKYNKMVWADILLLLVLTFCIWLSTNLQRINHSTNPMDLLSNLQEPGVFRREMGAADLKPTPLGQCMLGGEMSYRADNFQLQWFYFLYQASRKHTDKTKDTELMTHAFCQLTLSSSGQFTLIFLCTLNM